MKTQIAIVGAGPIGLEAALRACVEGYNVRIYESGTIAENIQKWGFVKLFSPFEMNSSKQGRGGVAECFPDCRLPKADTILTGEEFRDQYLLPLSRIPILQEKIQENSKVIAIGRDHLSKREKVGHETRSHDRFRILVESSSGEEIHFANVVLDCSGTYGHHRWVGAGGVPCVGERSSLAKKSYLIPDVVSESHNQFLGKTALVIGSGYSAATTIVALSKLAQQNANTNTIWITRCRRDVPIARIENDPLDERDQLARQANVVARASDSAVQWIPNASILEIDHREDGCYRVLVRVEAIGAETQRELLVDEIVANVGYKPNRSLYEELQIHECYATQGPIKLAARLMGETSNDCLTQSSQGIETLQNPEPNIYILGSKSYGRDSRFLIRTGLEQIDQLFESLAEKRNSKTDSKTNLQ